jgi:hypothetical protein
MQPNNSGSLCSFISYSRAKVIPTVTYEKIKTSGYLVQQANLPRVVVHILPEVSAILIDRPIFPCKLEYKLTLSRLETFRVCSRRRFGEHQAENWWNENRDKVYERYNVRSSERVSSAASTRSAY